MNPDGTADRNLRSFYGPQDSGRVIDERGTTLGSNTPDYTAPLKFTSGVRSINARFGTVLGGTENALDCNNHAEVKVSAELWDIEACKYGFTVKGGASAEIEGVVRGHGRECDVDLGNGSDQSHDWSSAVLNLRHEWPGDKIRVRVLAANRPKLVLGSGPYRFIFPWPWLPMRWLWVKAFLQLRRMGWFR